MQARMCASRPSASAVWFTDSLLEPGRWGKSFAEHRGLSAVALLQVAESMLQTFLEYNSSMAKTGDFRDVHKEDLLRVGTTLQWCSRALCCSVAVL